MVQRIVNTSIHKQSPDNVGNFPHCAGAVDRVELNPYSAMQKYARLIAGAANNSFNYRFYGKLYWTRTFLLSVINALTWTGILLFHGFI